MALLVTVQRRWPWQQEDFYSDAQIGVNFNAGVLTVTTEHQTRSYNSTQWKTVTSRDVPTRSRV